MQTANQLDLNFGLPRRMPRPLGTLLLLIGISGGAYALTQLEAAYRSRNQEKAINDEAASRLAVLTRSTLARTPTSPAELQKVQSAVAVAEQLRTPWGKLLKLLETTPVQDIALLSIEPVAANGRLRLSAEAKNLSVMLDYLAFLQHQTVLRQVVLTSHQVQRQAPGNAVRFQVEARWGES